MADYIKREAAKRLFADSHDYGLARKLDAIPAADVVEVKHGRWVQVICHEEFEDGFVDRVKECCSVCHAPNWRRTSNYCPNCGASMDGAADKNVGHTIPVNDLYDEDGGEVMTDGR